MKKEIIYPIRINKYLAYNNFCTRREADEIIKSGRVKVNGKPAALGYQVLEHDEVAIEKDTRKNKKLVYLAYNKPRGIVTHSPQEGEKSIENIFNFSQKVFPVGRLDKDSYGLIILTNDGRITDRLLNPDHCHEKEYIVKVDRAISPGFIKNMADGVILDDGYKTRNCEVKKIDELSFSIILTEGKKRQIRRMCEKLERKVLDLKRVRITNIKLRNLKTKEYREIIGEEKNILLKSIGVL
ncbi:MAG TPA: 23S rRNA pseudouridine synthase F [Candidatus Moranbacteria bacterium]|nr:23S rRNA pseudouridine synthase F [Candidatus Moranbacteria bacterium]HAT75221.1 23S rRNA pseudouridine synthase F [Candidatus Moranbacteria bacterium]